MAKAGRPSRLSSAMSIFSISGLIAKGTVCAERPGRGVDWIVVGGETGAKEARYMEPDWARDL